MQAKKINDRYIIRLEKGEEIIKTLTIFCEEKEITAGSISGIGATDDVTLRFYDLKVKKYFSKSIRGENFEITSLVGNVSMVNDQPFPHIHATLCDSNFKSIGGHLESAVISITSEIIITSIPARITRKLDPEFNVNFLDL